MPGKKVTKKKAIKKASKKVAKKAKKPAASTEPCAHYRLGVADDRSLSCADCSTPIPGHVAGAIPGTVIDRSPEKNPAPAKDSWDSSTKPH